MASHSYNPPSPLYNSTSHVTVTIALSMAGHAFFDLCIRWISAGLLIMGLGSLVFTLPHFTTAPYNTR